MSKAKAEVKLLLCPAVKRAWAKLGARFKALPSSAPRVEKDKFWSRVRRHASKD